MSVLISLATPLTAHANHIAAAHPIMICIVELIIMLTLLLLCGVALTMMKTCSRPLENCRSPELIRSCQ